VNFEKALLLHPNLSIHHFVHYHQIHKIERILNNSLFL
jgi:hypothetical protein